MGYIKTWVTADDSRIYPALVDLSDRWNGWLSPRLDIDAVRELARHTQGMNERYDEIQVIEGASGPIVLHVRWQFLEDGPSDAVTVEAPDEHGLYSIGAWEWTWSQVKDGPLFYTQNEAHDAWAKVLAYTGRRIGEILRARMPKATACLVNLGDGIGHIEDVEVTGVADDDLNRGDLFDGRTLSEAEAVLRKTLEHGQDPINLEISGWRPARELGDPHVFRVPFAPLGCEANGDGPLNEARTKATEVRRKLLTETAPYLVRDIRADYPDATGVIVDPAADQPFLALVLDDQRPAVGDPDDYLTRKVADRLEAMFVYRPTAEDLAACGWTEHTSPNMDGAHVLTFPAQ